MLLFAGKLTQTFFNLCCQISGTLLRLYVSVVKIFNKVRHSITPYLSDLLIILMSSSSISSVGIPSERSILRNSFIPLIKRLHSKSVSFSFVFLLNIKMTSLYLVTPFYKEVCVLSNVRNLFAMFVIKIYHHFFNSLKIKGRHRAMIAF